MIRILVVCMANICRSPLAEGALREAIRKARLDREFEVDSAGTHVGAAGEKPDRRALQVALARGYDIARLRARAVADKDFQRFDRILAMDRDNLAALARRCPPEFAGKLALFLEHAAGVDTDEVPDPYFGSLAGFERVAELCEAAAQGLLDAYRRGVWPGPR